METTEVSFCGSGGCLKHICFAISCGVVLFVDMFFLIRTMKHISRADCRFEWCCYEHFQMSSQYFFKDMFLACFAWSFSETFHVPCTGRTSHHKVGAGGTKYTKQSRYRRRGRQCVQYLFYRAFGDQYLS